ncbi:unnamed protein product [Agarophyton chilense]
MVHNYIDLATAINAGVDRRRTVDVFGVVVDCRAPSTTNGTDLRCEIVLVDESCILPDGNLKKFSVHRFVSTPSEAISFRELGDIARIHRAALIDFSRFGDTPVRQGRLKFYSTVQMWKHNADDFEPIAQPDTGQAQKRSPDPIDCYDMRRIRELRKWTKDFLFTHYKSQRPYLRTVTDILSAPTGATFLTKSFDLICYVHQFAVSNAQDLTMTASDGTGHPRRSVRISSQPPWRTRGIPRLFSFLDFCPSWNARPQISSWLLIRDARVVDRGVGREIELSVNVRTSTLIWNAENAPDVRLAKERCEMRLPNGHSNDGVTRDLLSVRHTPNTTPKRPRAWDGPNVHNQEQPQQIIVNGEDADHISVKVPRLNQPCARTTTENNSLQNGAANLNGTHTRLLNSDEATTKSIYIGNAHSGVGLVPQAESNLPNTGNKRADIKPVPYTALNCTRRGDNRIDIKLAPHEKVITVHNYANRKVWRISDMVQAFRRDSSEKLFRLAVWARGIAWPRDLRHACRPICANCERGVLMAGNNCDDCGSRMKLWQFVLRLILQERSGGASIESWVIGKDAELLLGLQASDLHTNNEKCDLLKRRFRTLHAAISVMDCLVVPYEYEDDMGLYRVACILKGTRLVT